MDAWARQTPIRRAVAATIGLAEAVAVPAPLRRTLTYTVRTMLAIGLALFISFSLQLLSPMSSVVTVLIVANPTSGALISKSLWRLFGTLVGAGVAVALMAAFAQTPLLFTVALSLCIGIACMVSSLLRYFRAYGAVLAGYTIIIVAAGSYMQPLDIFIGALSRVSAVSVGIVSAALVFLLTALPAPSTLTGTIELLVRDIAAGFVFYRRPEGVPHAGDLAALPRPALLARAAGLDEMIEYAGADSYALHRRVGRLRLGAARLLGLLSAMEPLRRGLEPASAEADEEPASAVADDARRIVQETMTMLSDLPGNGLAASLPELEAARDRVGSLRRSVDTPAALAQVMHEHDVLDQLAHAVADLSGAGPADIGIRLRPYLEWATAARNGIRGFLVTLLGGLAWYVTQWTAGPIMLSFLIPAACLLSASPSASKASVEFATGAIAAIGGSMLYQTFVLPQISGYPLLWASLCLFLAPGIWLQFHPVHRNRAFAYVVFFNAMISVHNPITYDDSALFNGWLAYLLGALCLMMVFRVLLPADPPREVRRLATSLGRAVELLSRQGPRPPGWEVWQNRQMQKILRLIQRLQQVPGADATALVQAAFTVVALGRIVLVLRRLRHDRDLPVAGREGAGEALRVLRRLRAGPLRAAMRIDAVQRALAEQPRSHDLPLLVGALGEAALLIRQAHGLLDRRLPLLGADAAAVAG